MKSVADSVSPLDVMLRRCTASKYVPNSLYVEQRDEAYVSPTLFLPAAILLCQRAA